MSNGLRFRAVRGVFPRNLPGVLKTSVILLSNISILRRMKKMPIIEAVHLIFAEDLCHVLVEEIQLVPNRKSKVFRLLPRELIDLLILLV